MLNGFSDGSSAVPAPMVKIGGIELAPIELGGKRFIMFSQVDQVHQRPAGTARRTFNENRNRFIDGKDFSRTSYVQLQKLGVEDANPNGATLLSESGYLKVVKTFRDDRAWDVYEMLIEAYFRVQAPIVDFNDTRTLQKMLMEHMSKQLALESKIAEDAPKVEGFEQFIAAKTSVPVEVFVKRMASTGFDIGRTRCFAWMREQKIIEKNRPLPYQEHIDSGHFTIRETTQVLRDGSTRIREQAMLTPKGQVWLATRLQKSYRNPGKGKK